MNRLTVAEFKQVATPEQLEVLSKLQGVFLNDVAYEHIDYIEVVEGDYLAEVFTSYGRLVTTVNLTRREYTVDPVEELCLVTRDLNEFTDWMSN